MHPGRRTTEEAAVITYTETEDTKEITETTETIEITEIAEDKIGKDRGTTETEGIKATDTSEGLRTTTEGAVTTGGPKAIAEITEIDSLLAS